MSERTLENNLYFDFSTRVLHVATVVILLMFFSFGELLSQNPLFFAIITPLVLYDILPYQSSKFRWIISSQFTGFLHYGAFFFLSAFFIESGNLLELLGLSLLITSSYWHGQNSFAISLSFLLATLVAAGWVQDTLDFIRISEIFIEVFLLGLTGGLVSRFTAHDRDERRKLQIYSEEANYERSRLRSLINSMADAVIATDDEGLVQLYNGASLGLVDTNKTIIHHPLSELLPLVDESGNRVELIELAKERNTIIQSDEYRYKNREGELLNLYINLAPVKIGHGEDGEEGYIILLRDITKEKSIEEQRDEFISIVSHELRTPIAIIEANISTAMSPKIDSSKAKRKGFMTQAHTNIVFLADLVNDITTLAHAERGDLEVPLDEIDPIETAKQLHQNYKSQAKEQKLKLELDVPEFLPKIKSNQHRLKEILQDFITNAIKYTEEGSVTIKVTQKDDKTIRFSIIDSGIGISTSDQKHLFEKFYRSEDFRTRAHSGTGLGLYIARRLAELMEAKLGVESKINKGSTFYVDVPVSKSTS